MLFENNENIDNNEIFHAAVKRYVGRWRELLCQFLPLEMAKFHCLVPFTLNFLVWFTSWDIGQYVILILSNCLLTRLWRQKIMLFSRKLNEISENQSFESEFVRIFEIWQFKVGFCFFKSQFSKYCMAEWVYMFKVNNRNGRAKCEVCSKLTITTPERRYWRRSGVLLLTLNIFHILF